MCQVVYLRGVQLNDLAAVLDYIYLGEASLPQQELQFFLSLAKDLQLRGLQTDDKTLVSDGEPTGARNTQVKLETLSETMSDFEEAQMKTAMHQNIDDQVKSLIEIGDIPAPGRSQGRVRICK